MREILFRGFHPDEKGTKKVFVNGEWIKGEWVNGYYEHWNGNTYIDNSSDDVVNSGGYPIRQHHEVISETIGQYTGLKDESDKMIFEGDILKVKRHLYEAVWTDGCLYAKQRNYLKGNVTRYCLVDGLCEQGAEVIGNIYENPELLKGVPNA